MFSLLTVIVSFTNGSHLFGLQTGNSKKFILSEGRLHLGGVTFWWCSVFNTTLKKISEGRMRRTRERDRSEDLARGQPRCAGIGQVWTAVPLWT